MNIAFNGLSTTNILSALRDEGFKFVRMINVFRSVLLQVYDPEIMPILCFCRINDRPTESHSETHAGRLSASGIRSKRRRLESPSETMVTDFLDTANRLSITGTSGFGEDRLVSVKEENSVIDVKETKKNFSQCNSGYAKEGFPRMKQKPSDSGSEILIEDAPGDEAT